MSGAALEIDLREYDRLQRALLGLSRTRFGKLMDGIGSEVVTQTQGRFADEESPDGKAWPEWSPEYKSTRPSGKSLLQDEGHLLTSITHNVIHGDMGVEVGSPQKYASLHNFGGSVRITAKSRRFFWWKYMQTGNAVWKNMALTKKDKFDIPQRQFLGLSDENAEDILGVVDDFMRGRMREEGFS